MRENGAVIAVVFDRHDTAWTAYLLRDAFARQASSIPIDTDADKTWLSLPAVSPHSLPVQHVIFGGAIVSESRKRPSGTLRGKCPLNSPGYWDMYLAY
eukprot:5590023-Pleurochrysis_carterae.AAC.1